jgi:hypothetical protein
MAARTGFLARGSEILGSLWDKAGRAGRLDVMREVVSLEFRNCDCVLVLSLVLVTLLLNPGHYERHIFGGMSNITIVVPTN